MKRTEIDQIISELRSDLRQSYPKLSFAFQAIETAEGELWDGEAALLSPNAVPKRRNEFLAGRMAARAALKGLGVPPVAILKGTRGEPIWPNGVVGSITHTDGLAIAAVTPDQVATGIGIDIEQEERFHPDLAGAILTEAEMSKYQNREISLGDVFTGKESTYKAVYPIIEKVIGFQDVSLKIDAESQSFSAQAETSFSRHYNKGETILDGQLFKSAGVILSVALLR